VSARSNPQHIQLNPHLAAAYVKAKMCLTSTLRNSSIMGLRSTPAILSKVYGNSFQGWGKYKSRNHTHMHQYCMLPLYRYLLLTRNSSCTARRTVNPNVRGKSTRERQRWMPIPVFYMWKLILDANNPNTQVLQLLNRTLEISVLLFVQQLSRRNSASTPQLLRITGFMIFNQKAYCSKSSVHFVVKVGINATQYKVMKGRKRKKIIESIQCRS
jgi:hypothetical protein